MTAAAVNAFASESVDLAWQEQDAQPPVKAASWFELAPISGHRDRELRRPAARHRPDVGPQGHRENPLRAALQRRGVRAGRARPGRLDDGVTVCATLRHPSPPCRWPPAPRSGRRRDREGRNGKPGLAPPLVPVRLPGNLGISPTKGRSLGLGRPEPRPVTGTFVAPRPILRIPCTPPTTTTPATPADGTDARRAAG